MSFLSLLLSHSSHYIAILNDLLWIPTDYCILYCIQMRHKDAQIISPCTYSQV